MCRRSSSTLGSSPSASALAPPPSVWEKMMDQAASSMSSTGSILYHFKLHPAAMLWGVLRLQLQQRCLGSGLEQDRFTSLIIVSHEAVVNPHQILQ